MSAKRLAIDWDALETALTWRLDEGGHYLDLTTGEIVSWSGLPDDEPWAAGELDAALNEGRLIPIEPLASDVEYGWMEEFAASVPDSRLRARLLSDLGRPHPFRRFKDTLAGHPSGRERWFAFHRERVRESAREWLEDVQADSEPPRQSRQ